MKNSLIFGIVFLAALAGASALTYGQTTYVSGYGPSYVDNGYNYNPYTSNSYGRTAYTCIGSGCSGIYGRSRPVTYTYRGYPAYPGQANSYYGNYYGNGYNGYDYNSYGSYGYAGYNPASYYRDQGLGYYPMLYTYGYDATGYGYY